jgi:hypothetical protein
MKTLLEKLKPEVLELLELEALEYPSTVERLKETLSNMNYWVELRIADATRLVSINKIYTPFTIEELSNLFNEEK